MKHGLVVGGCGVVNHRWWWLVVKDCFGFVGYGGFVVGVGNWIVLNLGLMFLVEINGSTSRKF